MIKKKKKKLLFRAEQKLNLFKFTKKKKIWTEIYMSFIIAMVINKYIW